MLWNCRVCVYVLRVGVGLGVVRLWMYETCNHRFFLGGSGGGSFERVPGTPMFFYAIFTVIILMLLNKASGFTIYFTGWRTFFLWGFLFGGEGMAIRTLFTNCFFFPFCYIFFLLFLVTGPIILPWGVYYFLVIWRGFICPLSPNLACKNL